MLLFFKDLTPKTPLGKIIASFCAVIGIMMLALPLGIIANNFGEYEKYSKRRKKVTDAFRQMDDELNGNMKRKSLKIIENANLQHQFQEIKSLNKKV